MDALISQLFEKLGNRGWKLSTAESCTGGMIAARVTDAAGASEFFDRGFITYSNESKIDQLGVPAYLIDDHGAVSSEVASAMARGVLEKSEAEIALSVTGIAGPGGGTTAKPVGLVYIGVATWEHTETYTHNFSGDRAAIRMQATTTAIKHAIETLSGPAKS